MNPDSELRTENLAKAENRSLEAAFSQFAGKEQSNEVLTRHDIVAPDRKVVLAQQ